LNNSASHGYIEINESLGYISDNGSFDKPNELLYYGNSTLGKDYEYIPNHVIINGKPVVKGVNGELISETSTEPGYRSNTYPRWINKTVYLKSPSQEYGPYLEVSHLGQFNGSLVYIAEKEEDEPYFYIDGDKKRRVPEDVPVSYSYGKQNLAYESIIEGKQRMILNGEAGEPVSSIYRTKEIGGKIVYSVGIENSDRSRIFYDNEPIANVSRVVNYVDTRNGLAAIIKGNNTYSVIREK